MENLGVARCHCFGGNVFTEMKRQAVMGVVAAAEVTRRGQINEPTEVAGESRESAISEVSYRWLDVNALRRVAHISAVFSFTSFLD